MSDENKEVKEIKISTAVREFADGVKEEKAFSINDDGTGLPKENFYVDRLSAATEIPVEKLNEIPAFNATFVPGFSLAFGEVVNEKFAANPDLKRVTMDVPTLNGEHYTFDIRRESRGLNPVSKEEVISFGALSVSHTTKAVANVGDYAKVRRLLKQQAESMFGG